MKVCTITCHDVYNHGASLQAYALMTYLEKIGHEVEIIDYKPDYLGNLYNLKSVDNPTWERNVITKAIYLSLKYPGRLKSLKRKRAFDEFTKINLKTTKIQYRTNEDLKNNLPQADAFICGSDQIWNSLHPNGKDPAFYLNFVPSDKIKASYAASFATDSIADEYKKLVKSNIEKLDGVAIREKSGVDIVKNLGIEKAIQVYDPAFLLNKDEWSSIINEEFNEKYILVYDFDKSTLIEEIAVKVAKARGYKIYTINVDNPKYADKSFRYSGPKTFISLVKNAEMVISNSFHAAVFSTIFERNFVIVNRTEAINTRMRDLLTDLGIIERLVGKDYDLNIILKDIDYTNVSKILSRKISKSKEYLSDILSIRK